MSQGFSYKIASSPSEHSDQHIHPRSLIRVFAATMWIAKDPQRLHAYHEDSDQTVQTRRLI